MLLITVMVCLLLTVVLFLTADRKNKVNAANINHNYNSMNRVQCQYCETKIQCSLQHNACQSSPIFVSPLTVMSVEDVLTIHCVHL